MADNAKPVEARKVEDRTHYLYIAVIVAMLAGIAVGALWPEFGKDLKWLGTLFVNLIKMMIAPIFCTIVLGIGSARAAAQVGRVESPWSTSSSHPLWRWRSACWWATSSSRATVCT
jgi:aerobic C4-dicarboxylate transport protein